MPAPLAPLLESLSGYRPAFAINDPRAAENPVSYSHVRVSAGKTYSVLSRVADYGLDYSQRTNKIAHHVALSSDERPEAGPAWLLAQPGFMDSRWDGQSRTLAAGRRVPTGAERAAACPTWAAITGDAGWAGVLAESWLTGTASYVIFAPGTDTLALIREAVALLPPHKRWDATFSTYYTGLPGSAACSCRCVLADSPEAIQARRLPNVLRIDLTQKLPTARGGELVTAARSGPPKRAVGRAESAKRPTPQATENAGLPTAIPLEGSTLRLRESASLPNMPSGPPPLEPRIRKLEEEKRVPLWVWLIASLSAAAVVFGAIFIFAINRARTTSNEVAGDAVGGEAKKAAQQPANSDKAKTGDAGKGDKAPDTSKTTAAAPSSTTSASKGEVAKSHDGKGNSQTASAATPKAENKQPEKAPANGAASKGDSKTVVQDRGAPEPPKEKAGTPSAKPPSGTAPTGESKKPEQLAANATSKGIPSAKHEQRPADPPLSLPNYRSLAHVKPNEEATLIDAKDLPDQSVPLSVTLWVPSDGKQSLTTSKRPPETIVLCETTNVTEDLAALRFDLQTHNVMIKTSKADALKALHFCVLCVSHGQERRTFQFLQTVVVTPTSPASDHKRPSWTIATPQSSQEMPPLAVDVAHVHVTSRTSQTMYSFRPEPSQGKKGDALLVSLMSSELNQRLVALAGTKLDRPDLKLPLHAKQRDSAVDFWFSSDDMKRVFGIVTSVQRGRLIDAIAHYYDPNPDTKEHNKAAARIKKQSGNEKQRIVAALRDFRKEVLSAFDPKKPQKFPPVLGDLDRLENDMEQAGNLQNDLNASTLKGARLFYNVKDQDGHLHRNYVVKLESDRLNAN